MKKLLILLCFALLVSATGCATKYSVGVSGLTAADKVAVMPNAVVIPFENMAANDLMFKELAVYVQNALAKHGYNTNHSLATANTAIVLGYSVGEPVEKVQVNDGPYFGMGGGYWNGWNGWGGSGWGWGPSIYVPIGGSVESYTTYGAHITLAAYDLAQAKATGKISYLWQILISTRSTSTDLRSLFPIMIAAAEPYIGTNTGQQIQVVITEEDPYLLELRSMMHNPETAVGQPRTNYMP